MAMTHARLTVSPPKLKEQPSCGPIAAFHNRGGAACQNAELRQSQDTKILNPRKDGTGKKTDTELPNSNEKGANDHSEWPTLIQARWVLSKDGRSTYAWMPQKYTKGWGPNRIQRFICFFLASWISNTFVSYLLFLKSKNNPKNIKQWDSWTPYYKWISEFG